ncbi:hypothetical protein N0V84_005980 [Fusarium piperis]|uniref:Uncharacterized protein n=1 Tax=Fusarium piperis TaxID=1435070 RepID=A0A9W9BPR5_9HYPO|nr:hypothetical protein N0V84_005980 [Fusarium piperis]
MGSVASLMSIAVGGYYSEGHMAPEVYRDLTALAACAILTYEKLFWLGIKEIRSKEILARAAIEVLKQSQEIVRFLKQVKTNVNDFEKTLSSLVVAMRTNLEIVAE